MPESPHTDEALLLSGEPEDFGRFYDRYVRSLLAYFQRRTRDPEVAADLTAETFAAALAARARFEARSVPASVWLFAIAHHKLTDYFRRGAAEDRMRRRLGVERVPVGAEDAEMIRLLGEEVAFQLVGELPRRAARRGARARARGPRLRRDRARERDERGDRAQAREPRPERAARPGGRRAMSEYIPRLREELVAAAAREHAGHRRRLAVRPSRVALVVAVAAVAATFVLAVSAIEVADDEKPVGTLPSGTALTYRVVRRPLATAPRWPSARPRCCGPGSPRPGSRTPG